MTTTEYTHLLELVKQRRTVRQFKPDPVPEGYVEKIIEVARWAPSGFHTQPWEFVVVRKPEIRQAVIDILDRSAPPITNQSRTGNGTTQSRKSFRDAPVFILLLADWRAKTGLPGRPSEVTPMVSSIYCSGLASAFLYLHLAAASLGLASQWYSSVSRPGVEEDIKKVIGIPEPLTIYDMMVLGYAAAPPGPKEVRELEEMIHYNDCGPGDFRIDEEVQAYAEKTREWCMREH